MFENEGDKQNKQGHHDIVESDAYQLRHAWMVGRMYLKLRPDVAFATS